MTGAATPLPEIDGDKCVHGLCATASCTACVTACPRRAFSMTDDALTFEAALCDGCGLCRPACPESAITFEGVSFDPYLDQDNATALYACDQSLAGRGTGVVPCLHAIGERDLEEAADAGIKDIVTARGSCAACPRATPRTFELALARLNLRRLSRRRSPLAHRDVPPAAWSRARQQASERGNDIDQSRRGWLGITLKSMPASVPAVAHAGAAGGADALFRFVPHLDQSRCDGCDACTRICPHGVISLKSDASGQGYSIDAEACTGCHLCADVCEPNAITLLEMAQAAVTHVALASAKCSKCGAPFHRPSAGVLAPSAGHGQRKNTEICRICQKKNHAGLLFQVRE